MVLLIQSRNVEGKPIQSPVCPNSNQEFTGKIKNYICNNNHKIHILYRDLGWIVLDKTKYWEEKAHTEK